MHAGAVDLGEDVVGQVGVEVQRLQAFAGAERLVVMAPKVPVVVVVRADFEQLAELFAGHLGHAVHEHNVELENPHAGVKRDCVGQPSGAGQNPLAIGQGNALYDAGERTADAQNVGN